MLLIIFTSILSFISTNIDDIFLLMILYAQAKDKKGRAVITFGQCLGMWILVGISMLGALGLGFLPERYIPCLGVIPIALGFKIWKDCQRGGRDRKGGSEDSREPSAEIKIWGVAMLTVASGADNIGVYTPVFGGYSLRELALAAVIFMAMTGLWCLAGCLLSSCPLVRERIQRYQHILVPVVLISLGLFILFG